MWLFSLVLLLLLPCSSGLDGVVGVDVAVYVVVSFEFFHVVDVLH